MVLPCQFPQLLSVAEVCVGVGMGVGKIELAITTQRAVEEAKTEGGHRRCYSDRYGEVAWKTPAVNFINLHLSFRVNMSHLSGM